MKVTMEVYTEEEVEVVTAAMKQLAEIKRLEIIRIRASMDEGPRMDSAHADCCSVPGGRELAVIGGNACAVPERSGSIVKQVEHYAPTAAPITRSYEKDDAGFISAFSEQAQRVGIPATLKLLQEEYKVARATEIPAELRDDVITQLWMMESAA